MNQKFQPGTPVILDFKGQKQVLNIKLKKGVSPEDVIFKVLKYEDDSRIYYGDRRKDIVKCEVISNNSTALIRSNDYYCVRNKFKHRKDPIAYFPESYLKLAPGVDLEEVIETWDEIFDI
jgi:hypothetical protein